MGLLHDVPPLLAGLFATAEADPRRMAFTVDRESRTYGRLTGAAVDVARSLMALGVRPGDRIALFMPNSVAFVEALLGVVLAGGVAVTVNARYRGDELRGVLTDSGARLVLVTDPPAPDVDHAGRLLEAVPGLEGPTAAMPVLPGGATPGAVVSLGARQRPGVVMRGAFLAAGARVPVAQVSRRVAAATPGAACVMLYTSGTTALPKGCPLSQRALACAAGGVGKHRIRLGERDTVWSAAPLFHLGALLPMLAALEVGARFVTTSYFEPGATVAQLRDEEVTVAFPNFDAIMMPVLDHGDFGAALLPGLRCVNIVGSEVALRRVQEALPQAVQVSAYGCTEAAGILAMHELDDPADVRATTCGRPFPGVEVATADPITHQVLPPGASGELLVRGACLFEGYHGDPVRTAEAVDAHGWFRTGDLGRVDEAGRVAYEGRLKDMLKVGGENVAAVEVESCLTRHEAVSVAHVVGATDHRLGQVPVAFVELRPGRSATEQQLIDHCRHRIASFKVPRAVRFVESWPMSATKVRKDVLRERIERELDEVPGTRPVTDA